MKVETLPKVLQQVGARRVLQLGAERQIIAHAVLADPHQRPLIADQAMRSSGVSTCSTALPKLTQRCRVVIKAVIAQRACVGEDELGAALQRELLLPLGQQEALLLARPKFR